MSDRTDRNPTLLPASYVESSDLQLFDDAYEDVPAGDDYDASGLDCSGRVLVEQIGSGLLPEYEADEECYQVADPYDDVRAMASKLLQEGMSEQAARRNVIEYEYELSDDTSSGEEGFSDDEYNALQARLGETASAHQEEEKQDSTTKNVGFVTAEKSESLTPTARGMPREKKLANVRGPKSKAAAASSQHVYVSGGSSAPESDDDQVGAKQSRAQEVTRLSKDEIGSRRQKRSAHESRGDILDKSVKKFKKPRYEEEGTGREDSSLKMLIRTKRALKSGGDVPSRKKESSPQKFYEQASKSDEACPTCCGPVQSDASGIYCSEQCIEKQAQNAKDIIGNLDERVMLVDSRAGRVLNGPLAPTLKMLLAYLKRHPTFLPVFTKPAPKLTHGLIKKADQPECSPADSTTNMGPDAMRMSLRRRLKDVLETRANEASDMLLTEAEIKQAAVSIEEELFRLHADTGAEYKSQFRTLVAHIQNPLNKGLFRRILTREILPAQLVTMGAEKLSSKEIAGWVDEKLDVQAQAKKNVDEQLRKSWEASLAERKTSRADEPFMKDTTAAHKSHLFDLNCKICTGRHRKAVPQVKKEVEREVGVSTPLLFQRDPLRLNESPRDPFQSPPRSNSPELRRSITQQSVPLVSATLPVLDRAPLQAAPADMSNALGDFIERPRPLTSAVVPKSILVVRETPKTTSLIAAASNADDSQSMPSTKAHVPSKYIWRGHIIMKDFCKFLSFAGHVSGHIKNLAQDVPETLEIVGRIPPSVVWEYITDIKRSGAKEFTVLKFAEPASDQDRQAYNLLFHNMVEKQRFSVIGHCNPKVKDFYLFPLSSNEPLPSALLPFDGPGLPIDNRRNLILGILVRNKVAKKTVQAASAPSQTSLPAKTVEIPLERGDPATKDILSDNVSLSPTQKVLSSVDVSVSHSSDRTSQEDTSEPLSDLSLMPANLIIDEPPRTPPPGAVVVPQSTQTPKKVGADASLFSSARLPASPAARFASPERPLLASPIRPSLKVTPPLAPSAAEAQHIASIRVMIDGLAAADDPAELASAVLKEIGSVPKYLQKSLVMYLNDAVMTKKKQMERERYSEQAECRQWEDESPASPPPGGTTAETVRLIPSDKPTTPPPLQPPPFMDSPMFGVAKATSSDAGTPDITQMMMNMMNMMHLMQMMSQGPAAPHASAFPQPPASSAAPVWLPTPRDPSIPTIRGTSDLLVQATPFAPPQLRHNTISRAPFNDRGPPILLTSATTAAPSASAPADGKGDVDYRVHYRDFTSDQFAADWSASYESPEAISPQYQRMAAAYGDVACPSPPLAPSSHPAQKGFRPPAPPNRPCIDYGDLDFHADAERPRAPMMGRGQPPQGGRFQKPPNRW